MRLAHKHAMKGIPMHGPGRSVWKDLDNLTSSIFVKFNVRDCIEIVTVASSRGIEAALGP